VGATHQVADGLSRKEGVKELQAISEPFM